VLPTGAHLLLIRLSALGDILFSLEALASLKEERPDIKIDFLVEDRFAELLKGHPHIDTLLIYPRRNKLAIPRSLLRLLRHRYDAILDLHGNLKSAMHVAFARSRHKLGFAAPRAREGAQRFYSQAVELPRQGSHRAEHGLYLLRALGLEGVPSRPVLPIFDEPTGEADGAIILHPGTSAWASFKRWPARNFAELAQRLMARNLRVAISYGPGEEHLADQIQTAAPGSKKIDGARIGLAQLPSVYARCRLLVGADTGPLHIAAATGTPVVALFGPKDPASYAPRGEHHRIIFADVPCRPCTRRRCPSPQCVLGLSVDEVERTVLDALS